MIFFFVEVDELKPEPLEKRGNTVDIVIPNPVYDWHAYSRQVMLFAKKKSATLLFKDIQNIITVAYDEGSPA